MSDFPADFDVADFLPYLLAQAAEATSRRFSRVYRDRHGMLRTEWRVLFHLGRFGEMTAGAISARAMIEKSKVSRAVARLADGGMVAAAADSADRRRAILSLTARGLEVFAELEREAAAFEAELRARLGPDDVAALKRSLRSLWSAYADR
ncbi:winged helix-turn-helix transcriptional regulator [Jannaschia sp. Os4]|uniref:MarR family winged helix-turn-helix transcriptional regulator n=1 Tax=Jannaschia sp. Os4 TaxID=2807617 RepID=UPI00193A97FB|nr:MarR family winged helix-turn-helix transcriptional regulator [Jannaschia sp. Os4]MBM2575577.1 winged helix-turn-helix transcriptional regulator [Jannaschia sp. Os4]